MKISKLTVGLCIDIGLHSNRIRPSNSHTHAAMFSLGLSVPHSVINDWLLFVSSVDMLLMKFICIFYFSVRFSLVLCMHDMNHALIFRFYCRSFVVIPHTNTRHHRLRHVIESTSGQYNGHAGKLYYCFWLLTRNSYTVCLLSIQRNRFVVSFFIWTFCIVLYWKKIISSISCCSKSILSWMNIVFSGVIITSQVPSRSALFNQKLLI